MNKSKAKKIQALLTTHLLDCGSIELRLPDGVSLEIGIVKDGKHGIEICDDYCFVKASREGNSTLLDTYNVGLQYAERDNTIICMDTSFDPEGRPVKRVEIV
jgi:hypothetical protein